MPKTAPHFTIHLIQSKFTLMNAIVVDDELDSLEATKLLIEKYCPQIKIVGTENSPERAISLIDELKPDLLFLDISMPIMNGFEVLKQLTYKDAEVIFTTAYDKYAIKGFQVGAVHYLLKPIEVKELKKAVDRAAKKLALKVNNHPKHTKSVTSINNQSRVAIPILKGLELVDVSSIIRCEADSNYSTIFTISNKIVIAKTLKELEQSLAEYDFIRVHHSHLINLAHLTTYIKGDGGQIILSNGEKINVSRSRKERLLEKLRKL